MHAMMARGPNAGASRLIGQTESLPRHLEHCMRRGSVIYYRPAGKPKWKSRINA